ncbi:MAG: FkbM family methyltransferase [Rhodospirillaceae bacterium]|nr:FkbM family methyltransferase [Rhodospirillaceae bacterium]
MVHNKKRNGYFVEVGVGDGTALSNTLILERDFGWTGVLAEPNRAFHDKIAKTRRAVLDKRAVYDISGKKMRFEEVAGVGELSGLGRHRTERGSPILSAYDVETVALDDLLAAHGAPSQIDYMSIDTEGSEVDILKGLSLKNRQVAFFTIEHNFDRKRLKAYHSILQPAGYREILPEISTFDAWFVHRDVQSDYI